MDAKNSLNYIVLLFYTIYFNIWLIYSKEEIETRTNLNLNF